MLFFITMIDRPHSEQEWADNADDPPQKDT